MPLPQTTSQLDPATGYQIPINSGTWANASTWASYTSWISQPSTSITVVGDIIDRGTAGYFNIKTTADYSGDISYSVFTSNTGEFQGEEVETIFTAYTTNVSAFYGRYFAVCANVSSSSGQCELRSLGIAHTNNTFDLRFDNMVSSNLDTNEFGSVLPMPRAVGAIKNIQATVHLPSDASARYVYTGNDDSGYIVNYNGNSTTLSNSITSAGEAIAYLAFNSVNSTPYSATSNGQLKIYKTINSREWSVLSNPANVTPNVSAVSFNTQGNILAVTGSTTTAPVRFYSRSGDTFTKMNDPNVFVPSPNTISWAPNGQHVAIIGDVRNSSSYPGTDDWRDVYVLYFNNNNFYEVTFPNVSQLRYNSVGSMSSRAIAWDPSSTYLAVALRCGTQGNVSLRPAHFEIYKKTAFDTFETIPTSNIQQPTWTDNGNQGPYYSSVAWHPSGNWVAFAGLDAGNFTNRIQIFYRSGDSFTRVYTLTNTGQSGMSPYALHYISWNPAGTHLLWGWTASLGGFGNKSTPFDVFAQTGNTFTYLNSTTNGSEWVPDQTNVSDSAPVWAIGGNVIVAPIRQSAGGGASANLITNFYNVTYYANSNIGLSKLTGINSNIGATYGASTFVQEYVSKIPVASVSIFNPTGGNIRVDGESMTYLVANATPNPPLLEGVTRGITTTQFGNSIAAGHNLGAQVFPIEQLDFDARYYDVQTITTLVAYIGSKNRAEPAINIKTLSGSDSDGTFDAVVNVLPEQYMDGSNLNYR